MATSLDLEIMAHLVVAMLVEEKNLTETNKNATIRHSIPSNLSFVNN